ncbi:DUF3426 domain-containing protein [Pseudomonas sp. 1176_21]|uniref:DUF3426 domain-containing protein n=1 Tax=Pseudomonas sp. 1176_21 TaxID=2604453 RepID=UPI000E2713D0
MTDSFVTQCPHCQTSFRVSHTQLSVARGVVRCGNCLQVFNAAKQLLEQSAAQQALQVAPALPPATPLPAPVAEPEHAPQPAPSAPAPISQREWTASALDVDLDQLDLDQELARLEQREIQPISEFKRSQAEDFDLAPRREDSLSAQRDGPDDTSYTDSLFSSPADERETQATPQPPLVDEPVPAAVALPGERTEPSLSLDLDGLDDEPPLREQPLHDPDVVAEHLSARDPGDEPDTPDPAFDDVPNTRHEPDLGPMAARSPRKPALVDIVDDPLQLDWQKPRSHWGRRLLWALLTLLAGAALAGQYIAYHFDELARQDQYRPWFQQLCPQLGCEVPSKVDIARIKSSNLVVRSHPDFAGALIVDAIIYNRAPFSQPFPLLELRFADLNGQLIASRRFKPGEYLSGELAGKAEMPSQTPIHIALDILDPGPKAVNYSLSFRSPE